MALPTPLGPGGVARCRVLVTGRCSAIPLQQAEGLVSEGTSVTEIEWLECTDPKVLLKESGETASSRQLRLFMVACCRRIWHLLPAEVYRQAILVAERHADGLASAEELRAADEDV